MTRVSRRKTLSHSEIESFLSDIDVAADLPAPPKAVEALQAEIKAQYCVPLSPAALPAAVDCVDPLRSEAQYIRDFCKATFATYRSGVPLEPTKALCDVGRSILRGSTYPILSRRLLCPENYEYPSSSLEAKKALLMSLSPMLTEAEEQRQKETSACENFTRCKSGKGKSKFSGYDYTDIDVKCQVDFAEYEKRYMLYIGQNKKTYAKDTPLSPSLNYITFQHRQRTKSERISGFPRRNLQSAMQAQGGENQMPSNLSPTPRVGKAVIKPKPEPVKLDDTTLELVQALLKPKPKTHGAPNSLTTAVPPMSAATTDELGFTLPAPPATVAYSYDPLPPTAPPVPTSHAAHPVTLHTVARSVDICVETTSETTVTRLASEATTVFSSVECSVEVTMTDTSTCCSTTAEVQYQGETALDEGTTNVTTTMTEDTAVCHLQHTPGKPPLSPAAEANDPHSLADDQDENGLMDLEDSVIENSGGPFGDGSGSATGSATGESNDRKRKHRGHRTRRIDRRGTLSPASVRAMLFGACEEDDAAGMPTDDILMFQEQDDAHTVTAPAPFENMLVVGGAEGLASPARQEALRTTAVTTTSPDKLYALQCPADEDLLFLEDFDRAESPQHEHGKKYARSGTPSALHEMRPEVSSMSCISVDSVDTDIAEEHGALSSPVDVEAPIVCPMEEVQETPLQAEDVTATVTVVVEEVQQSVWVEAGVEEEVVEEVCMDYSTSMTVVSDIHSPYTAAPSTHEACEELAVEAVTEYTPIATSIGDGVSESCASPNTSSGPALGESLVESVDIWEKSPAPSVEIREEISSLTSAEMEVIQDFGRELDDILCDVSALGTSPSFLLRASPHSPNAPSSPLSDAEVMCLSPYELSQASRASESAEDSTPGVAEEVVDVFTPTPVDEAITEEGQASPVPAQDGDVAPCTYPDTMYGVTAMASEDLAAYPVAPRTSACEAHISDADAPEAEVPEMDRSVDRSVDISTCSDGDLSTSMDDSQIIFDNHDPDLEDFEMLESLVHQEFSAGALAWEFSLPALTKTEESNSSQVSSEVKSSKPTDLVLNTPGSSTSTHRRSTSSEVRRSGVSSIPRYSPSAAAANKPASPNAVLFSSPLRGSPLQSSPRSNSGAPSSSQARASSLSPLRYGGTLPASSHESSQNAVSVSVEAAAVVAEVTEAWPEPLDISSVRARAQARYEEKLKVARWQCEWDVVSAQAANSALIRLNRN